MNKKNNIILISLIFIFLVVLISFYLKKSDDSSIDLFTNYTFKKTFTPKNKQNTIVVKGICTRGKNKIQTALITLHLLNSTKIFKTVSDENGKFEFKNIPISKFYILNAYVVGYKSIQDLKISRKDVEHIILDFIKIIKVEVRVLNIKEQPVKQASVLFSGSGYLSQEEKISDNEGKVFFDDIPAGIYDILAFKDDFVGEISGMEISPDNTVVIHLYLKKGVFLKGLVRDDNTGKPIENAEFSFSAEQPGIIVRYTTTDSNGKFKIGPFVKGNYKFSLVAENYISLSGRRYWIDGKGFALFELSKGFSILGTIENEVGDKIKNATVEIFGTDEFGHLISPLVLGNSGIIQSGTLGYVSKKQNISINANGLSVTDSQGKFSIKGMPPAWLALKVTAKGYASKLKILGRVLKNKKDILIRLKRGKNFIGSISDDMGIKIPYVEVNLESKLGISKVVFSDQNGDFKLFDVPDKFTLIFRHPNYPVKIEQITISENRKNFILKRGNKILDLYFRDKQSINIENAFVSIRSLSRPESYTGKTDKNGHIKFKNLSDDLYEVSLNHKNYPFFIQKKVNIGRHDYILKFGGGFSVFVRDFDTKEKITNAHILLFGKDGETIEKYTDQNGECKFFSLKAGNWNVVIQKNKYAKLNAKVTVEEASIPRDLSSGERIFELKFAGSVAGIVRDEKNFPVKRAFVTCNDVAVKTDYNGFFKCDNLESGTVKIHAWHYIYGEGSFETTVDKGLVTRDVVIDLAGFENSKSKIKIKFEKLRASGITIIKDWGRYKNLKPKYEGLWEVLNVNGISAALPLHILENQLYTNRGRSIYVVLGISGIPLRTIYFKSLDNTDN